MSTKYPGGFINASAGYSVASGAAANAGYIQLAGASAFSIPTAATPFTVEAWVYPLAAGSAIFSEIFTGAGNTVSLVCSLATASDVSVTAGLRPAFGWYNGTAWTTAAATDAGNAISLNTWTHLAFVFTGATCKIYKNGVDITSATPTPQTSWGITTVSGDGWYIGRRWDGGGTTAFTGYISGFRFVVGTAVYTSAFAPPGLLTAIPNTVLLTAQYPTLSDGSSNNFQVNGVNNLAVSNFSPFAGVQPLNPALGNGANGVWTLDQMTSAMASNTWPAFDPFYNSNGLLINGTGTNGATNSTFLDSSGNGFAVTLNGETAQGDFTPFDPNGWGMYVNNAANYINNVGTSANINLGAGDFCIEGFFFITTNATSLALVSKGASSILGYVVWISGGLLTATIASTVITGVTTISAGEWHHFAFVRSGTATGNIKLYLDGVLEAQSATGITTNFSDTATFNIGKDRTGGTVYFYGYLSNIRMVKGAPVYTSNFTPPAAPLAPIANTQLLTLQDNYFVDNSTNAFPLTLVGTPAIVPRGPFSLKQVFSPAAIGGSAFFDGAGDFLTLPSNAAFGFGTGDFKLETWFYATAVSKAAGTIFDFRANTGATSQVKPTLYLNTSTLTYFTANAVRITSAGIAPNQWYYVSLERVSGVTRMYLNGAQVGSNYTDTNDYGTTSDVVIGESGYNRTVDGYFPGYLAATKITKGSTVSALLNYENSGILSTVGANGYTTGGFSVSTAQSKWGGGSLVCSNSSGVRNLMLIPANPNIELLTTTTTGDYTIEFWIYPLNFTVTTSNGLILSKDAVASTNYGQYTFRVNSGGNILFSLGVATGAVTIQTLTGNIPLTLNAWNHVAGVKYLSTLYLFVNGRIAATATSTVTPVYVGRPLWINGQGGAVTNDGFNGYLNDIRITQGYARYLGEFQPPTSALQGQ